MSIERFPNAAGGLARLVLLTALIGSTPLGFAQEFDYVSPLEPPDTSSPRATLETFTKNYERAYQDFYRLYDFHLVDRAAAMRMIRALDTSKLPPVQSRRLALEAAILLNDVLDRVELPAWDTIPDAEAMRERPADEPRRWTVPGTEITIERIEDGDRRGEYLFTSETVRRAHEFYERAQDMPYRSTAMEGLYAHIISMGGPWFPEGMVKVLPGWAKSHVLGQAAWKWAAMALLVALWVAIVYGLRRLSGPRDEKPRYWLRFLATLAVLPLTRFLRWFADQQLILAGAVFEFVDTAIVVLYYLVSATAIIYLGRAVAATLVASPRIDRQSFDANLITVGVRACAWLVAIFLLAHGASNLGVPLAAVITSLGVGGLAFAMAARPTLENLIAGVTLYLDKPVRVGEFCQFEDVLGKVERIGLRSTRIRRWGGNMLSIPNSQFAEYQLDNFNDARYIWIRQKLRLRYETSADQLRFLLAKLREMLFAHPKVLVPRVRLIGFGDDALTVEVLGYSDTSVWSEWHAIREDVYLRIMEIVEASGTRLALPSQTTYFARDDGVDEEKKHAAEEQVHEWTQKGELPFPDMTEEQREALGGTVDFPPKGSVAYKPLEHAASDESDGSENGEKSERDKS